MFEAVPETASVMGVLGTGFLAGVIKGVVGFALPVVLVSGLSVFLPPEIALAAIVVPAIVANVWQGMRQGPRAALQSVARFRVLLGVGLVVLLASAQLVPGMSERALLLALGAPIVSIAIIQLAGWRPVIAGSKRLSEVLAGVVVGIFGGLAGMFGPPLVLYLTAIGTQKAEQVRVQGVVFTLGAMTYGVAHFISGIVRWETLSLSFLITAPVLAGLAVGFFVQDKVNQQTFRTLTLIVLLLAGLNLMRKAVIG